MYNNIDSLVYVQKNCSANGVVFLEFGRTINNMYAFFPFGATAI